MAMRLPFSHRVAPKPARFRYDLPEQVRQRIFITLEQRGRQGLNPFSMDTVLQEVGELAYAKHLMTTLLSLGAHGECLIVGRGSAQVLAPATTLRVRLIAPLPQRASIISERVGIRLDEAQRRAKKIDKEQADFVDSYFHKDSVDPHNYDLVLNVARFGVVGSAKVIIEALEGLKANAPVAGNSGD